MSNAEHSGSGLSRREMIKRLLGAGCTACLGALATSCPGGSTWGKPQQHGEGLADQLRHRADSVPLNSVKPVIVNGEMAYLVHFEKDGQEHWTALENKCSHKKSTLNFNESEHFFKCPLHDSEYNLDGSLREREGPKGWPAKKPLRSWPVEVEGEMVVIRADAPGPGGDAGGADSMPAGDDDDHGGHDDDGDDDSGRGGDDG